MLLDGKPITSQSAIKAFNLKKETLKKLGIKNYVSESKFKDIKQIFESDTGMVIGQCLKDCAMNINSNTPLNLKAGEGYVMPLNHFVQGYKAKDKTNVIFKPYRKSFTELFNRYKGQDLTNKKILISRTGGLGDLVVSQSVLKGIKEKYPSCKITYATTPAFIDLFRTFPNGLIDGVASIPYNQKLLRDHDYHMLFIHAIENCISTQKQNYYDIYKEISCLDYDVQKNMSELIPIDNIVKKLKMENIVKKNTILLHMASTTPLRSTNNEVWVDVINLLLNKGYEVGIIDSKSKSDELDTFIHGIQVDMTRVHNFAKYSESISIGVSIASMCRGAIVIDSTFAHITGALKIPTVALCGPYPAYNVIGAYETVVGAEKEPEWNVCGKAPCFLNSQHHLCPFLLANQRPGCLTSVSAEKMVNLLEGQLNKFSKD